eukprot:9464176-Pyramimonas_sp.AAC.3
MSKPLAATSVQNMSGESPDLHQSPANTWQHAMSERGLERTGQHGGTRGNSCACVCAGIYCLFFGMQSLFWPDGMRHRRGAA